jgi:hypothetical protein
MFIRRVLLVLRRLYTPIFERPWRLQKTRSRRGSMISDVTPSFGAAASQRRARALLADGYGRALVGERKTCQGKSWSNPRCRAKAVHPGRLPARRGQWFRLDA